MRLDDFLSRLDGVRQRGMRWSARCPAHDDRSPSLQISEGERGLLIRCWAGCTLTAICANLGIELKDLFTDALDPDPRQRRVAAEERDRQRQKRERHAEQQGTLIDALREADYFVQSRRRIDISTWSHDRLNDELNSLGDAYRLLEHEALYG